jgi:hypothetical protein
LSFSTKNEESKSGLMEIDTSSKGEEKKEGEDSLQNVLNERNVGKGIANALNVFRERGMLGKTQALGRNKEKTVDE